MADKLLNLLTIQYQKLTLVANVLYIILYQAISIYLSLDPFLSFYAIRTSRSPVSPILRDTGFIFEWLSMLYHRVFSIIMTVSCHVMHDWSPLFCFVGIIIIIIKQILLQCR